MNHSVTLTIKSHSRAEIRQELVEQFLKEEPGTGKDEQTSRYDYTVEVLPGGHEVHLSRPAYLNKGFDFGVCVPTINFKPQGGNRHMPSHDDIKADIKAKCDERPELQAALWEAITTIYECQEVPGEVLAQLQYTAGHPIDVILSCIKWLFIEQDVTYWNWSGRNKLYSALKELFYRINTQTMPENTEQLVRPELVKTFSDGSTLEYDEGKFDIWQVMLTRPNVRRSGPRDQDYFQRILNYGNTYGKQQVYDDFCKIYDATEASLHPDPVVLDLIEELSAKYGKDSLDICIDFTILYLGMIAEENKANSILGKRLKRLGMYQVLMEGFAPRIAAVFSRKNRYGKEPKHERDWKYDMARQIAKDRNINAPSDNELDDIIGYKKPYQLLADICTHRGF